jgi:hypothetical protein
LRIVGTTRNILINTTTDAGFRLDVNGTARIVGATRIDTLAGTGTRMVVADANGVMSTQSLSTQINGTGFVKADGTTISYDNSNYVTTSRTLTINGTAFDLSEDRSWTVSTNVAPLYLDATAKVVTNEGAGSSPFGSTSFGLGALFNNTTGYFNTVYGFNALGYNNEGSENVAIGVNSVGGFSDTINPVYRNTGVGTLALFSIKSSSDNVAVGFRSGVGDSLIHGIDFNTINNSVFIGSDARALANAQTNQIVIGHNAIGLGSNTAVLGNDAITLTRLRGQVNMGSIKLDAMNTAPASATATGVLGEIRVTATHIYVCTATDTWVRSALTTF